MIGSLHNLFALKRLIFFFPFFEMNARGTHALREVVRAHLALIPVHNFFCLVYENAEPSWLGQVACIHLDQTPHVFWLLALRFVELSSFKNVIIRRLFACFHTTCGSFSRQARMSVSGA
jgi:hypothetical protein